MRVEKNTIKLEEKLNKMLEKREETFRIEIKKMEELNFENYKIKLIFIKSEEIQNRLDKMEELINEINSIVDKKKILDRQYENKNYSILQNFYKIKKNINEFDLDLSFKSIYKIGDLSITSYNNFIDILIILKNIFLKFIEVEKVDSLEILNKFISQMEKVLNSFKKDFELVKLLSENQSNSHEVREFFGKHNKWISYRFDEYKTANEFYISIKSNFKKKKSKFIILNNILHEHYQITYFETSSKLRFNDSAGIKLIKNISNNDNNNDNYYFRSYLLDDPMVFFTNIKKYTRLEYYMLKRYIGTLNHEKKEYRFIDNVIQYNLYADQSDKIEMYYKNAKKIFNEMYYNKNSRELLGKIK